MAFWLDIAAFALKALILVLAVAAAALLIARAARGRREEPDDVELERLDARGERARRGSGLSSSTGSSARPI